MNIQRKARDGETSVVVSAAEANRNFSKLLRDVQAGVTVTITSRGKPVAVMTAADKDAAAAEEADRNRRWNAYIEELRSSPAMNLGRFNREDAYD